MPPYAASMRQAPRHLASAASSAVATIAGSENCPGAPDGL